MSLSQILRIECTQCGKVAVESSRFTIGKSTMIRLACGHLMTQSSHVLDDKAYDSIISSDGKKPRPYQVDGIKFLEAADFKAILADEQGLGKTIMSLSLMRLHTAKLLPAVIIAPATVLIQWMREVHRWCGDAKDKTFLTQVIRSKKDRALPGFQIYIVSFDILKEEALFEYLEPDAIKTVIIDECQRIKNHLSDRAKAVQKLCYGVKHIIPMSGTPIKNHSGEYFTVLNLVDPLNFRNYTQFVDTYCENYNDGWGTKVGGLRDPERFHADTRNIILRRTKAEVLKDLPPLDRQFHHVELSRSVDKAYESALEELNDVLYDDELSEFDRNSNTIAIMSKMRHITGISKVSAAVEFATDFVMSNVRKLTIFIHHQDVGSLLESQLNTWLKDGGFSNCLMLTASLNAEGRQALVDKFKADPHSRIMIASTLAAGEGLNLQFCSDAIMLERQWNPANEEQAEARFHRFGQEYNVTVTYMIASGTIDEYFTELVEVKRSIVASTVDNKEVKWDQSSLIKELANKLISMGKKAWKL